MTVEFSDGYIKAAEEKLRAIESTMSPEAIAMAKEVYKDLRKSSTRWPTERLKPRSSSSRISSPS